MIRRSNRTVGGWSRPALVRWCHRLGASPALRVALCFALVRGTAYPGDILRGGAVASSASNPTAPPANAAIPAAISAMTVTTQDRLARTTQALAAVRAMQNAARAAATAAGAPNNLRPNLPAVPVNSFGQPNGLLVAAGVPKDLANPGAGEDATLWQGAKLPVATTQTSGGATTSTVTVEQTQQQAVLNWQSFNIGRNTTLAFDQSAGGDNAAQWIAFNKIGVTGSPSQILGAITAQGQVYVINPNGIIFGGSSQVNAHALVASSLPINDNLIARGLLNNPDAQFLFTGLALPAGSQTAAFTPLVSDVISPTSAGGTFTSSRKVSTVSSVTLTYLADAGGTVALVPVTGTTGDFTVTPTPGGQATVTLTDAGLAKVAGRQVSLSYTPAADQYGDVVVQPGAVLAAPTNADHVGGRIALVGPNVTNAGTLSAPDGQVILAAGLQVGMAAHPKEDPTLRGLDVYVGKVTDASADPAYSAGTVTNDRNSAQVTDADVTVTYADGATATVAKGTPVPGLIETSDLYAKNTDGSAAAPVDLPGSIMMTGRTVNQLGVVATSTSVAYNGRVDLLADYNAVPNPFYGNAQDFASMNLAFVFPSNAGNTLTGAAIKSAGVVNVGADSVLSIVPEIASTDRVVGLLALPSQVQIQGGSVQFAAGSTLFAPGAAAPDNPALGIDGQALDGGVTVRAGGWHYLGRGVPVFAYTSADQTISFAAGAAISVAGLVDVPAATTENVVSVELRGAELANSPLQRTGALRGQTIQVDVRQHGPWDPSLNNGTGGYTWVGTPLADTSGWIGLATHSVGELSVNGGSVVLKAGGAVTLGSGTAIDVSGGSIAYAAGYVQTTKVLSQGHIFDISQATPDRVYDGIYTGTTTTVDPKWGVTQTSVASFPLGAYEGGYVQGGNGGGISIVAPALTLDGSLLGTTIAGPLQRTLAPKFTGAPADNPLSMVMFQGQYLPTSSALSLTFSAQTTDPSNPAQFVSYLPAPTSIVLGSGHSTDPSILYLSPELIDASSPSFAGFGRLLVDNSDDNFGQSGADVGAFTVPAGAAITMVPGGSVTVRSANIDVEGALTAPGGALALTAYDVSPSKAFLAARVQAAPPRDPGRGSFILGSEASLSTAGLVVDNRATSPTAGTMPVVAAGGTVAIAGQSLDLEAGGTIDVSGGAVVGSSGKPAYGNAGSISLSAGQDPGIPSVTGGGLTPGAALLGYSGSTGGKLSIFAPLIQIGGSTLLNGGTASDTLWLDPTDASGGLQGPDFFSQGGFASFALKAVGRVNTGPNASDSPYLPAILIAPGTTIAPVVRSWLAATDGSQGGAVKLTPTTQMAGLRNAVNLSFTGVGLNDINGQPLVYGNFVMEAGAAIRTDPQTTRTLGVAINADSVAVLGSIVAPGGTIAISGSDGHGAAVATVDLAPGSVLDASGTTVFTPNARNLTTGTVLRGGAITVTGNVVAEGAVRDSSGAIVAPAAVLNVSGASHVLDVPVTATGPVAGGGSGAGADYASARVDSDGGEITLAGKNELFTDATLLGVAGGSTARGGSLTISSGILPPSAGSVPSPTDPTIEVVPTGPTFASKLPGLPVLGRPVLDAKGNVVSLVDQATGGNIYGGHFAADSFAAGGFDSLTLKGSVQFSGKVSITARGSLDVGTGGVVLADPDVATRVSLAAPYVALGTALARPIQTPLSPFTQAVAPTYGSGTLTVQAGSLIDVGSLSLQNIGAATLDAGSGDIRGDGVLDVAGDLKLAAGQIYVPTAVSFTIAAHDYITATGGVGTGTVTILPSGSPTPRPLPLSAGGTLNVFGATIIDGGTLRAPLGAINLGSDGSAVDLLSGLLYERTRQVTLQAGSVTSVSAVDPATGQALTIPYGINVNGTTWVDPQGADITAAGNGAPGQGLPIKAVNISAGSVTIASASGSLPAAKIDLSGGGDLYAYRWIPGVGGNVDVLLSSASFAIIPGYQADYAPFAANAVTSGSSLLGGDPGYLNSSLTVGDRVYLEAGAGLPAGTYTLLPARYALLPGAFLVTPQAAGTVPPAQAVTQPDGSVVVGGYRTNAFSPTAPLFASFSVARGTAPDPAAKDAPPSVVRGRAQYADFFANGFFSQSATAANLAVPRLPVDAGQLVLESDGALNLQGNVAAQAAAGGRGGWVDIATPSDLYIGSAGGAPTGAVQLDPATLDQFGAESLLIGGKRVSGSQGVTIEVVADSLTVDNAGAPLKAPEIILAANLSLTLAPGADVEQSGQLSGTADTLLLGGSGASRPDQIIQLGTAGGSSLALGVGTTVVLPQGTPGNDQISLTGTGVIVSGGTSTPFSGTADTPFTTTLAPEASVAFAAAGTMAFAGGQGGRIPVGVPAGARVSGTGTTNRSQLAVQLGGGSSLSDLAAGTSLRFPSGTSGTDQVALTGSGVITSGGASTAFSGDSDTPFTTALPAGCTVTFAASGAGNPASIALPSDAAGLVSVILPGGTTFSANAVTNITPAGGGSGALVRVSSDAAARVVRTNIDALGLPILSIGGARLLGANTTLDSTAATSLDPTATLGGPGSSVVLDSGQISIRLDGAGVLRQQANGQTTTGLVLTGGTLGSLQSSASALTLLSYSSIDIYGSGQIGSPDFASLSLHAPELHGDGGSITFAAKDILIDNSPNAAAPDGMTPAAGETLAGSLTFDATTVRLGSNSVAIGHYADVGVAASDRLVLQGAGGLATQGNLTITAPAVVAQAPAASATATAGTPTIDETIAASGDLSIAAPAGGAAASAAGDLGASLSVSGQSVAIGTRISLPSGSLAIHATGPDGSGDVTIGGAATLDVAGTAKTFNDVTRYTNAGQVSLTADDGSVEVATGAVVNLSAQPGGGNAGSLSVVAPHGALALAEGAALEGQGGANGAGGPDGQQGGLFSLDVSSIPGEVAGTSSLAALGETLATGGFTRSASIRVRTGDIVVDGPLVAHAISLTTDQGGIAVTADGLLDAAGKATDTAGKVVAVSSRLADGTWKVDPSGAIVDATGNGVTLQGGTGGSINLAASGSITLASGAQLTVAATNFDAAGKGGAVSLAAGAMIRRADGSYGTDSAATVNIGAGSTIDLSVASVNRNPDPNAVANAAALGRFTGTLHLRAPQTRDGSDVQIGPIAGTITSPSSVVVEGFRTYQPAGGVIDTVTGTVKDDGAAFAGGTDSAGLTRPGHTAAIASRLLAANPAAETLAAVLHVQPGAEIVNTAAPDVPTALTLNPTGSLMLPAGGVIAFPLGGAGLLFSTGGTISGAAGSITSADGSTTTAFTAAATTTFPSGSVVTLTTPGTVTLSEKGTLALSAGAPAVAVDLPAGSRYTLGGTNGAAVAAGNGACVTLKTPGFGTGSAIAVAAGVGIVFPYGTPGADLIQSSQSGRILAPSGAVTTFAASSPTPVPAGGVIVLDGDGVVRFASGSAGAPIQVVLSSGNYTTSGAVDLATSAGGLLLAKTWDLSSYRFGPDAGRIDPVSGLPVAGAGEPGVLTLRAAGNLIFGYDPGTSTAASLSDGFDTSAYGIWFGQLLAPGTRSWSYRLVAGADLAAADGARVRPLAGAESPGGSVLLGWGSPAMADLMAPNSSLTGKRADTVRKLFQTIRTGTGDIAITAQADVQLLNPLATIYTAGTRVADPTALFAEGDFSLPSLAYSNSVSGLGLNQNPVFTTFYPAQYSYGGGNVSITAQNDIAHLVAATGQPDSSKEMPNNWLYRRGYVDPTDGEFGVTHKGGETASTSWWIDFSNFYEGVGALGGGNVTLAAGRNVSNVDAVVPTNARMPDGVPDAAKLVELGGGNLAVSAGQDVDGGVYYVERGSGTLSAGGGIHTNATRTALTQTAVAALTTPSGIASDPTTWLPTTLFLGKGGYDVTAKGDVLLGSVANPFLLPQGIDNAYYDKTLFSTYAPDDSVNVASLSGNITLRGGTADGTGTLAAWYDNLLRYDAGFRETVASQAQPWLKLVEDSPGAFSTEFGLMPPTLRATAFSGSLDLVGKLTLSPSPTGTIELLAGGSVNGVQPYGLLDATQERDPVSNPRVWSSSLVNLSDADPGRIPAAASPSAAILVGRNPSTQGDDGAALAGIDASFAETGATAGPAVVLQNQQALHGADPNSPGDRLEPLHAGDPEPVRVYAAGGDISGLTLFSGKAAQVMAGNDVTDVALYLQNVTATDVSLVAAGRDIIAYDPNSTLRLAAQTSGNVLQFPQGSVEPGSPSPTAGDIQISGPGTLEVLAGRNLDLGLGSPSLGDGTAVGITSVGKGRNPLLPFAGADVVTAVGIGPAAGLAASRLDYAGFVTKFLDPATAGANAGRYLPVLAGLLGLDPKTTGNDQVWAEFQSLPDQTAPEHEAKDRLLLDVFYAVLRDAGRDHNNPDSPGFKNYSAGEAAIAALFPGSPVPSTETTGASPWSGVVSLATRELATFEGGDISVLAPGGDITVGRPSDPQSPDQGILTEHGGNISLFASGSINVGTSRVFTLRGGNEIIWATLGNIAAGSGSKTVHAAPPTRVLIDPQSGDVQNDLAGLATGSGIGVLATLKGVAPGDVDLIAPVGTIDAGDAGIRASGNLNVAARVILNASNIQVGGVSAGTPPPPAPPNLAPLTTASSTTAAVTSAAADVARQETAATTQTVEIPSIITVEVLGYGGEDDDDPGGGLNGAQP